jgi:hypothetical protein
MEFAPLFFIFFNIGLERWEEAVVSIEKKRCLVEYITHLVSSNHLFFVTLQQKMNAQI